MPGGWPPILNAAVGCGKNRPPQPPKPLASESGSGLSIMADDLWGVPSPPKVLGLCVPWLVAMRNIGRYLVGHQNPKFSTSSHPVATVSPEVPPGDGGTKGTLYALARSSGEPAWIVAELITLHTGQA